MGRKGEADSKTPWHEFAIFDVNAGSAVDAGQLTQTRLGG